jgi:hypothetical protein
MNREGRSIYSVASVARNFIGIREFTANESTSISIKTDSSNNQYILLQIFTSPIFYEFWRTLGDGFHVTTELLEKFPISPSLYHQCVKNVDIAKLMWMNRKKYLKTKLNKGKLINTYDFSDFSISNYSANN